MSTCSSLQRAVDKGGSTSGHTVNQSRPFPSTTTKPTTGTTTHKNIKGAFETCFAQGLDLSELTTTTTTQPTPSTSNAAVLLQIKRQEAQQRQQQEQEDAQMAQLVQARTQKLQQQQQRQQQQPKDARAATVKAALTQQDRSNKNRQQQWMGSLLVHMHQKDNDHSETRNRKKGGKHRGVSTKASPRGLLPHTLQVKKSSKSKLAASKVKSKYQSGNHKKPTVATKTKKRSKY